MENPATIKIDSKNLEKNIVDWSKLKWTLQNI